MPLFRWCCCWLLTIGLLPVAGAQQPHVFKLPQGIISQEHYEVFQGEKIITRYEITFTDSVQQQVWLERYKKNSYWRLLQYRLENDKPVLSGWQYDYDDEGKLVLKQLCNGSRKCPSTCKYTYYPGGQPLSVTEYYKEALHGHQYLFYTNGQLRQHLYYENGRLAEVLAMYSEDGAVLDVGTFCHGNGNIHVYSMDGIAYKTKWYKNGKLKKEKKLS